MGTRCRGFGRGRTRGGDRLVILLPILASVVQVLVKRIQAHLEHEVAAAIRIGRRLGAISCGVAEQPDDGEAVVRVDVSRGKVRFPFRIPF